MSADSIVSSVTGTVAGYVSQVGGAVSSLVSEMHPSITRVQFTPGHMEGLDELAAVTTGLRTEAERIKALANDLLGKLPSVDSVGAAPTTPDVQLPAAPVIGSSPVQAPTFAGISLANAPDMPALDMPVVPSISVPDIPAAPAIAVPSAPALDNNIALPPPPVVQLPDFDAVFKPPFELKPLAVDLSRLQPEADAEWVSTAYTLLMNAVNEGLSKGPLPGTEESELYQRARNRLADEYADRRNEVTQRYAALNYPAPPGAQMAALQRLTEKEASELQQLNAQIMDTQLTKRVEHQRFLLDVLQRVDAQCMQWLAGVRERIQDGILRLAEAKTAEYNANLQMLNTAVDLFRTEAQVFGERVRAASLALDVYRGQLEGAKMRGELNMQQVQLYSAMVEAQKALVHMYGTQLDAVDSAVKAQMGKVEIFRAQVDGVKARADVFEAGVRAVESKNRAEATKVEVYGRQVDAWKTGEEVRLRQFDAQLQQHEAGVKTAMAKYEAFQASTEVFRSKVSALVARYGAYSAQAGIITSTGNTIVNALGQMGDAATKAAQITAQYNTSFAEANVAAYRVASEAEAEALKARAAALTLHASTASSAINAIGQMGAGVAIEVTKKS